MVQAGAGSLTAASSEWEGDTSLPISLRITEIYRMSKHAATIFVVLHSVWVFD